MNGVNTKARACGDKMRHTTRYRARSHMFRLVRLGAALAALNTYKCRHCDGWHVGHRPQQKRGANR